MMTEFDDSPARGVSAPERGPIVHDLKCWPEFYDAIAAGEKRHDLRPRL